ncbi:MAG: bacterial proteasome activator family protein [Acidimicrobiales bacterium]
MTDEATPTPPAPAEALRPEIVDGVTPVPSAADTDESGGADAETRVESIEQPAKLLRIGSMVKQLLDEVRSAPLDEASRGRLREIYEQSIRELADGLSPDLVAELDRVSIPFDTDTPSDAELRIAHAQLVGWLEGLFHGIQATLVAQQVAARAQLDEMRQRSLTGGENTTVGRPGTYL